MLIVMSTMFSTHLKSQVHLRFLPLITILTISPAAGITQELVSNPDVSLLHSSSLTCLNCPSSCTWTLRTCLLDYICTAVSSLPNSKQRTDVEQQGITWALTWWKRKSPTYMQKAGDTWDISPQFFLDFPQNFRLRTRNQYCTQAIAWGSTI